MEHFGLTEYDSVLSHKKTNLVENVEGRRVLFLEDDETSRRYVNLYSMVSIRSL